MIWKLLRKNISAAQLAGYALASLAGLAIVLTAIRFYADAWSALHPRGDGPAGDYLVVSKPVSMLGSLGLGAKSQGITQAEIDDLAGQPWAQSVGEFTTAAFSVTASIDFQGQGMWTYLFLESVPDDFVDVIPGDWHFDPEAPGAAVPVLIPRDYLQLYNFGFAASRGMPQVTEGVLTHIPFDLYLTGNGQADRYRAHIAGLSDRINTIAVPQAFLDWANARYSAKPAGAPTRLIVHVTDAGNPEIERYLSAHGLETGGRGLDQGRAAYLLRIATAVVVAIGVVISALALFILMLSITLLLQKNREKNRSLLLLGYSVGQVSGCYMRLVGIINAAVLAGAIAIMLGASTLWQRPLAQLGIATGATAWPAIGVGAAIMAAITAINFAAIRRSVARAARE